MRWMGTWYGAYRTAQRTQYKDSYSTWVRFVRCGGRVPLLWKREIFLCRLYSVLPRDTLAASPPLHFQICSSRTLSFRLSPTPGALPSLVLPRRAGSSSFPPHTGAPPEIVCCCTRALNYLAAFQNTYAAHRDWAVQGRRCTTKGDQITSGRSPRHSEHEFVTSHTA